MEVSPALIFDISQQELKNKAIPLQAGTGPNVSRGLRFPDFKKICT